MILYSIIVLTSIIHFESINYILLHHHNSNNYKYIKIIKIYKIYEILLKEL